MSKQFSICQDCEQLKFCVLTTQKDKVWSCSEYEEVAHISEDKEIEQTLDNFSSKEISKAEALSLV